MHVNLDLDVYYGFLIGFLFYFTCMDLSLCFVVLGLLNFMPPFCASDMVYMYYVTM